MYTRDNFLIGSRWVEPAGPDRLYVVSPTTEKVIGSVPESTPADMDAAVASARKAFDDGEWPRMPVRERGDYLLAMMKLLASRTEEMARLQTDEMGSPYKWISAATSRVVGDIARYVDGAAAIPLREYRDGNAGKVAVLREPVGVAVGIIPWNGPVISLIGKIMPALLTGCPIIVKPALETPLSAYILAEAAVQAGLPEGVLSIVAGGREVGEHLVTHPGVDRVSFTGSTAAGARVAALCGESLKSATLELGGKSAAIVLDDIDLDARLGDLIASSLPNTGQVCHATTRILVPRGRKAEIIDALVSRIAGMKVGDPQQADTEFGPLVAQRQRDRVEGFIAEGREQGAKVALGGGRPAGLDRGWFVEPTVFTDVDNKMTIAQQEIFGPVLSVIDYDTVDDAIRIANDSTYGLGGAVFTSDVDRGLEVATHLRTGTCRLNEAPSGGGGGPFGGFKNSGLGRERGREGFESYYELKSVTLPSGYAPAEG